MAALLESLSTLFATSPKVVPIAKAGFKPWSTTIVRCELKVKVMAYATFAVTTAATQGSYFAVSGQTQFQWMMLCNICTKFCDKVAAALFFGLAAFFLLAVVSCAYNVFSFPSNSGLYNEMALFWKARIEKMYEELGAMEAGFFSLEEEQKLKEVFEQLKIAKRVARREARRLASQGSKKGTLIEEGQKD
ncbi:CASP-like protein 2C1 [Nymphaea thermarum]|nr:CASP-like protein 2C1 [Nymphaea thermarum]